MYVIFTFALMWCDEWVEGTAVGPVPFTHHKGEKIKKLKKLSDEFQICIAFSYSTLAHNQVE